MDITDKKGHIQKIVEGIKNEYTKQNKSKKVLFSNQAKGEMFMSVALINIPIIRTDGTTRRFICSSKIPHTFVDKTMDVLLVTTKRYENESAAKSAAYYKDLLRIHNALPLLTEIISLRDLQFNYQHHEIQNKLFKQYDIILCDNRIHSVTLKALGVKFIKKNKMPIGVNMFAKDLRLEISYHLNQSYLRFSMGGNHGRAQVGKLSQSSEELVENVMAVLSTWKYRMLGGWENVRSVHLRSRLSVAFPIYLSVAAPTVGPVARLKEPRGDFVVAEDVLSTLADGFVVQVWKSGHLRVVPADRSMRALMAPQPPQGKNLVTDLRSVGYARDQIKHLKVEHNMPVSDDEVLRLYYMEQTKTPVERVPTVDFDADLGDPVEALRQGDEDSDSGLEGDEEMEGGFELDDQDMADVCPELSGPKSKRAKFDFDEGLGDVAAALKQT